MKIEDINFDEEDKNLFLIDDLQLKADAIRLSILPRLEIIANELISRIVEVFEIDYYQNYSIAKTPAFRLSKTQRKEITKKNYTYSSVSICGQRKDNKWLGLDKENGEIPKISPTQISIDLTTDGLTGSFFFNYPKNFTKQTYKKFFDFFLKEISLISGLANKANMEYDTLFLDTFTIEEDLKYRFESEDYDVLFITKPISFPINFEKVNDILYSTLLFFPVLNACISIALGKEPNIHQDIEKLEGKFLGYIEKYYSGISNNEVAGLNKEQINEIKNLAGTKVKVQAGLRWQVFKRDNWRCLSCGRCAEDNIILHVDHILPRSKGGKDEINNYQTLCEICNIGKSNKDDTDLRKKNGLRNNLG